MDQPKSVSTGKPPLSNGVTGGPIPIYRRDYGTVRASGSGRGAVTPRPLFWQGGQLRQIEVPSRLSVPSSFDNGSSVSSPLASAYMVGGGSRLSTPLAGGFRNRGGIRRSGRGGSTPAAQKNRSMRPSDGTHLFKIPEMDSSLPLSRRRPTLPTDPLLPPFTLSREEPLPPNSVLFPALVNGDQNSANTASASLVAGDGAPASKKMKSSNVDDLDIETLKSYRRLNGYTLFTLAMKKKYGLSDDTPSGTGPGGGGQDQKSQNRRWQALWSTLPERERQQWRVRARRTQKVVEAAPEKSQAAEAKRAAELRRTEAQLARSETSRYSLLDLAAHFQLLANSFGTVSDQLAEYQGPVPLEDVMSSLLDCLLSCLIPLTAIAGELEPLAGAPDKLTVCAGLSSLAHVFPKFK